MKIALNIFTNSTSSSPSTDIIRQTIMSFWDTFESIPLTIYVDENPNKEKFLEYYINLSQLFPEIKIIKTQSLSEGYIKSVKDSKDDFLFQLEHDFVFNKDLIKHNLEYITHIMKIENIYHLRFNKRNNTVALWDTYLESCEALYYDGINSSIEYCETPCLSNNPHIIHVKKYREKCLPFLKVVSGSKGIEENLLNKGLTGCIYGGAGYPATIIHQDGRSSK